ncbi:MAG: hypothetical protein IPN92_08370 [Chromatiaceae bacterium]|nr:hypothetical protein [Chromatiaceae bacterium]
MVDFGRHDLFGCQEAQAFSGAGVQRGGDLGQVALGQPGEVYPLGEVLPPQAVDVRVGKALLGAVGVGAGDPQVQPLIANPGHHAQRLRTLLTENFEIIGL